MYMMLLVLLTGTMCRWSLKEIFWWNQIVSSKGVRSCFGIAPLVRWFWNGDSFSVNEVHMRNSMERTYWSEFEGLIAEDWTCATIEAEDCCKQGWIIVAIWPVKWQKVLRIHPSPSTLPRGPGNKLGGFEEMQTKLSPGVGSEEQPR